jgi:hypothetical protein
MTGPGTSQPWQLPRRTAGHGPKAGAGAQPLTEREQRIAEEQEIERLQRIEETSLSSATGAPRQRGCPAWVVLGVKAVEGPRDYPADHERVAPAAFRHPGDSVRGCVGLDVPQLTTVKHLRQTRPS